MQIIPDYEAVEVAACGEEDSALGGFREFVGEADVFFGLRPAGNEENVDRDAVAGALETFAHGGLLGPRVRGIEHVKLRSFEVRSGQAVGDENDLLVGCVLRGEQAAGHLQRLLDIREMRRDAAFADLVVAHVDLQPHNGIINRHGLGHHFDDLAGAFELREGRHFDHGEVIARVFFADDAFKREGHAFDVDVLAVVAHRAAHVHDHRRGALGVVARFVDDDVVGLHSQGAFVVLAEEHVDEGLRQVDVGHRIAEFVAHGRLHFDRAFADDRAGVAA